MIRTLLLTVALLTGALVYAQEASAPSTTNTPPPAGSPQVGMHRQEMNGQRKGEMMEHKKEMMEKREIKREEAIKKIDEALVKIDERMKYLTERKAKLIEKRAKIEKMEAGAKIDTHEFAEEEGGMQGRMQGRPMSRQGQEHGQQGQGMTPPPAGAQK